MAKFYFITESDKTDEEMEQILVESRISGVVNTCERNNIGVETFLTWYKFSRKKRNKANLREEIEFEGKSGKENKEEIKIKGKRNLNVPIGKIEKKLDQNFLEKTLDQLTYPEINNKNAIQLLSQYFLRKGCIREPKGRKGYEVRITAFTLSELKEIRACIKKLGYNLCNVYEKRGNYVQPIYGTNVAFDLRELVKVKNSRKKKKK